MACFFINAVTKVSLRIEFRPKPVFVSFCISFYLAMFYFRLLSLSEADYVMQAGTSNHNSVSSRNHRSISRKIQTKTKSGNRFKKIIRIRRIKKE